MVTVVTKKKEKKSTGTEVDLDSEEDEESDESTIKELKKKAKSKKNIQAAQCKYYCTCASSFSVFFIFCNSVYFDIISPFFCILCFPFLGYGSNEEKRIEEYGYRS